MPTRGTYTGGIVTLVGISLRRLVASSETTKLSRPNGAESSLYTRLARSLQCYKKKKDLYTFFGVFEVFVSLPAERSKARYMTECFKI